MDRKLWSMLEFFWSDWEKMIKELGFQARRVNLRVI
jgi:hypothetical protein